MTKVVCPGCAGPVELAASGRRVEWHKPWRVGRGGLLHQSSRDPLCTGYDPDADPTTMWQPWAGHTAQVEVSAV